MNTARETPFEIPRTSAGRLRGIRHEPVTPSRRPGILMLHGWSGNRLGPHRMFVHLARQLAEDGWPCARIDFAGRGDSDGPTAGAGIPSMVQDTLDTVHHLEANGWTATVLLGICSGCKVALGAASRLPGIHGLILWSPERMGFLAETSSASRRTRNILQTYLRKALHPSTWIKLFSGRVHMKSVSRALWSPEQSSRDERSLESKWLQDIPRTFSGPTLLIFGSQDPDTPLASTAYPAWLKQAGIPFHMHILSGANHSFYGLDWEQEVRQITHTWLNTHGKP